MDQPTWMFLGMVALLVTWATFYTDVQDILGGLIGMIAWGFWALAATNVEIVTSTMSVTKSYDSLAWFGAGMAALMLLTMLAGAGTILDVRDEGLIEEQQR